MTDLHPLTVLQNARTSSAGYVAAVPTQAATVGPLETWKAQRVSIWHAGHHDNPFGQRLTALMISKKLLILIKKSKMDHKWNWKKMMMTLRTLHP